MRLHFSSTFALPLLAVTALAAPAGASASELARQFDEVGVTIEAGGDAISYVAAPLPAGFTITSENGFSGGSGCSLVDGIWRCQRDATFIPTVTRVLGSPADDAVSGTCRRPVQSKLIFSGGAGADVVQLAGCRGELVNGDDGNDVLTGGPLADTLDGGAGRDTLHGRGGDDTLAGGPGRDALVSGPGRDVLSGGDDGDTVSYADRAATVRVSLDGQANDGEDGEQDDLRDFEDVIGGEGDDEIRGDAGPNDLDGGAGSDVIDGGPGNDDIHGGPGSDIISARDGMIDQIRCGEGIDRAVVDVFDVVIECEDVQASRELMADVDADGIPAPADCDDRSAAIRPGLRDLPGNRVDEDCLAGDAPFARVHTDVQWAVIPTQRWTRFVRLSLNGIPAGATIELRCRGRAQRCFRGVYRVHVKQGAARLNLLRPLRGRRLKRGARLELRVRAPESIAKVVTFDVRANRLPRTTRLCLAPGQLAPHPCR